MKKKIKITCLGWKHLLEKNLKKQNNTHGKPSLKLPVRIKYLLIHFKDKIKFALTEKYSLKTSPFFSSYLWTFVLKYNSSFCYTFVIRSLLEKFNLVDHSTMIEKSLKALAFIRQRNGFSRLKIYIELLYPGLGDAFSKLKSWKSTVWVSSVSLEFLSPALCEWFLM